MQDGKYLRTGINGQPQPQDLFGAAQPGAQFVQLDIRKLEMTEKMLVEALSVLPCAGQPGDNRRLTVAEDPLGGGRVQAFGQSRQYNGDLVRGSLQPVQWGVAPGTERGVAGLTTKRLDPLGLAMLAIADERMDVSVCDAEVRALLIGTGETLGVYAFGGSPAAFHLTPGTYWRRRRFHHGRVGAGEVAVGAVKWGAWLEQTVDHGLHHACSPVRKAMMEPIQATKPRQGEQEQEQKEEHEHMKGHRILAA
jgi:hypothetical protein